MKLNWCDIDERGDEVREATDILFRSLKDKDLQASFDMPNADPDSAAAVRCRKRHSGAR
jgi:hypothetical protein